MAMHLVYPVGMSHQTLWQQTIIQDDEGMTCSSTNSWKQMTHKGTLTGHYSPQISPLSLKSHVIYYISWNTEICLICMCVHSPPSYINIQVSTVRQMGRNSIKSTVFIEDNIRSYSKEGNAASVFNLKNFADNSYPHLTQTLCYVFSHSHKLKSVNLSDLVQKNKNVCVPLCCLTIEAADNQLSFTPPH